VRVRVESSLLRFLELSSGESSIPLVSFSF
jgi:hypothetical protein